MKISDLCKKWDQARGEAEKTTCPSDLARVLQEIDNYFNEILDYLVFTQN